MPQRSVWYIWRSENHPRTSVYHGSQTNGRKERSFRYRMNASLHASAKSAQQILYPLFTAWCAIKSSNFATKLMRERQYRRQFVKFQERIFVSRKSGSTFQKLALLSVQSVMYKFTRIHRILNSNSGQFCQLPNFCFFQSRYVASSWTNFFRKKHTKFRRIRYQV